jgi:hypothetical protein
MKIPDLDQSSCCRGSSMALVFVRIKTVEYIDPISLIMASLIFQ